MQESPWGQEASFEGRWDATGQSIPSAEYWGRLREMKMFLDKNSKQLQYQLIAIQKILKIDWKIVFPGVRRRPTCKACRRGSIDNMIYNVMIVFIIYHVIFYIIYYQGGGAQRLDRPADQEAHWGGGLSRSTYKSQASSKKFSTL